MFSTTLSITPADALGSQIDFVRTTARLAYFLPFGPEKKTVDLNSRAEVEESKLQHWFRQSMLAFGARVGVIKGVNGSEIPIDERFFNGGANSVRSFGERDLGPHVNGDPIGGEFLSVYNVEYTFPIFGELQGAIFFDAGNLLPNADDAGFADMRYGDWRRAALQIADRSDPTRLRFQSRPARGRRFRRVSFQFRICLLNHALKTVIRPAQTARDLAKILITLFSLREQ